MTYFLNIPHCSQEHLIKLLLIIDWYLLLPLLHLTSNKNEKKSPFRDRISSFISLCLHLYEVVWSHSNNKVVASRHKTCMHTFASRFFIEHLLFYTFTKVINAPLLEIHMRDFLRMCGGVQLRWIIRKINLIYRVEEREVKATKISQAPSKYSNSPPSKLYNVLIRIELANNLFIMLLLLLFTLI